GRLVAGARDAVFSSASIDSRAVAPGALFFAVKGDRFDGHDFVAAAAQAGARGVVVAKDRAAGLALGGATDVAVIEVDDVVAALGAIAAAHRATMTDLKVVG